MSGELHHSPDYFVHHDGPIDPPCPGPREAIERELSNKRVKATHAEGLQEGLWVLLDLDDVIVHIFYHEQRKFYDLDGLWHDAKRVDISAICQDSPLS